MGRHHWARGGGGRGVCSKSRHPDSLQKSTCVWLIGSLQGSWPAFVRSLRGSADWGDWVAQETHREFKWVFIEVYPCRQQRASKPSV